MATTQDGPASPEVRAYYVSIIDGRRYNLLAGPFHTHQEALALVHRVRDEAYEVNAREAAFAAFGTCSLQDAAAVRIGLLNDRLKITPTWRADLPQSPPIEEEVA